MGLTVSVEGGCRASHGFRHVFASQDLVTRRIAFRRSMTRCVSGSGEG